ncbi:MAG: laccase domain-containing protein [Patescibacteria group bacterium]
MAEISEVPQNLLEVQLIADVKEIREKMGRIEELTEIQYLPGFENKVGYFPKLEGLEGKPVLARFSYGRDAPNMSSVFFDSSLTKEEGQEQGAKNTKEFLESQGFSGPTIQVLGKFEGVEAQIEEVDKDTIKEKTKVVGNMVFTRDPEITLMIKPADCPVFIFTGDDEHGNPFVAIDHCGADAINVGITRQSVWYLENILGADLSKVKVAIFPGVSRKNFDISREWITQTGELKRRDSGIPEMNWREFIDESKTSDPMEKRHVDILSAAEMQALQSGIKPENIQAYRIDTYEDAANGIAYSRRYSNEHNGEHNGGQIVAVQLKNKIAEMPIPSQSNDLAKAA